MKRCFVWNMSTFWRAQHTCHFPCFFKLNFSICQHFWCNTRITDEMSHLQDVKCPGSIRCFHTKFKIQGKELTSTWPCDGRISLPTILLQILSMILSEMTMKITCGSLSSSWSLTKPSSCSYKTTKLCQPTWQWFDDMMTILISMIMSMVIQNQHHQP